MSALRRLASVATPWAGLVIGLIALIVVHQFGSQGTFDDCRDLAPVPVFVVAAVGMVICLAAGFVSWRGTRGSGEQARQLIGIISAACAVFFSFAIVLAMIAVLMLPPCFA